MYEAADITVTGSYTDLVYYKKGSEIWGTPVASDCFGLVAIENQQTTAKPVIEVFPNPARTEARILLRNYNPVENLRYALYNFSGMKVDEGDVSSNPFILERNSLGSGLYVLIISDMIGTIKATTKLNFD